MIGRGLEMGESRRREKESSRSGDGDLRKWRVIEKGDPAKARAEAGVIADHSKTPGVRVDGLQPKKRKEKDFNIFMIFGP
jgi:hypothetical protein